MKTKSKILSILLVLAMVLSIIPATVRAEESTTETATLVKNVTDLKVGDRIVIANADGTKVMSTNQKSSNRGAVDGTPNKETLPVGDDFQVIELKEGKVSGTFAFYVKGDKTGYLYAPGNENGLKTMETLEDKGSWTISIESNGVATIKSNTSGEKNWLRYNDGSTLFNCYKSGQKDVSIYKLPEAPACTHAETEYVCDASQHWIVCKACKEIQGEKANHNIVDGVCECGFKISTVAEALAGAAGAKFAVKGVVTLVDYQNVYVQDATGGICLYLSEKDSNISLGDTVIGYGSRTDYNNLPELGSATIKVEEKGNGVAPAAKETTIGALTDGDVCTYVTIKYLTVTDVYDGKDHSYTQPNITVKDADGKTIQLYKAAIAKVNEEWPIKTGDILTVTGALGINNTDYRLRTSSSGDIVVHEHDGEWKKSEDGSKHYYECEECGYKSEEAAHVDADKDNKCDDCGKQLCTTSHTYGDWEQTKAPTCTVKGEKKHICTVCGNEETEEIAAIGKHTLTKVEKVEATTEKEGCKEHYKCECGKLFTDAEGKNETTADKLVIAKLTNTENKNENTIILVINGKYVTGTEYLYKYTNKQGNELQKYELVVSENKADALELIRVDNADDTVTFKTKDGKFLYADGTNVQLKDAEGEHTKFVLETTEGGYFLKCANATYNNNAQYLEVYNGYLTCYGKYDNSDATIYTFKLEAVKAAEDDKKDDTSDKKDDTSDKKDDTTTTTGTYTKVTDGKLVSGTYVLVVTVGDKGVYAPSVLDNKWLLSEQPTISGNDVTDAKGATITLVVDGDTVVIKDANGKVLGNSKTNIVEKADAKWNWKYDEATGTFTFDNGDENPRYLAATNRKENFGQFRAYYELKEANEYGEFYYNHFTLYKLTEKTGDTTVKPSKTELKPISKTPVAETGYKYGMYNKKLDKTLYITGEMSGYYLATTTDASKAANVYLETVEGGYKLYFKNADGKKQYIEIYSYEYESNGEKKTGVDVQIVDEATNIYTWNAELKVLVSNVNGEDYYLGTYYNASKDTTYETMSASKLTYISGDNASKIGDTQYPAYLYEEVNVSTGDDTNLMAIVAMMVVAMAGMAVVVINRKRETV